MNTNETIISENELRVNLHEILGRVLLGEDVLVKGEQEEAVRLTRAASQGAALKQKRSAEEITDTLRHMRSFREAHPLNGLSIREMIDEGRKY